MKGVMMQIRKKVTALCTAFMICISSLSTVCECRITVNASVEMRATILAGPSIPVPIIENEPEEIIEMETNNEESISEDESVVNEEIIGLSQEEIELLALVTMAEAEDEPEEGKRLVIDTILNRVNSERFDNTVEEVIYAKGQFSSMWNGRIDRCYISDEIVKLVKEEVNEQVDYEVLYFTADHYGLYGEPMFSIGNHYFSR